MFEKASRMKLRFKTVKGLVTTEDLWTIPLVHKSTGFSLDEIAKNLNRQLKESKEESFVVKKSITNELISLKFEIVKYIIKVRLEEKEAKEKELLKSAQKEKILSLIAEKKDDDLKGKSIEELYKELENL